jgi:hypothetical protein
VDGTANTKDLLDSRSVVYYSLTLTMYVRAEDPLSLPLFQHTTGPAFVPWLVIHSRTVEEKGTGERKNDQDPRRHNWVSAWQAMG